MPQTQLSRSTVVAVVTAAAVVVVSMAAVVLEAVSAVVVAVSAVAATMAVDLVVDLGVAAGLSAGVDSVAGVDSKAEEATPAAVRNLVAVPRRQVIRIFLPPSTMASGIRSATAPVQRVLVSVVPRVPVAAVPCVPAQDAIPAARRTQPSPLAILAWPMAPGTPLAHRLGAHPEAPVS
ncbi:MAG: hypothetical protein ACLPVW_19540 [Terriglobales bacterium]